MASSIRYLYSPLYCLASFTPICVSPFLPAFLHPISFLHVFLHWHFSVCLFFHFTHPCLYLLLIRYKFFSPCLITVYSPFLHSHLLPLFTSSPPPMHTPAIAPPPPFLDINNIRPSSLSPSRAIPQGFTPFYYIPQATIFYAGKTR